MAAPTLVDLPDDVLCHIMKLADQPTRLAAMETCSRLGTAASAPGVWTDVTFRDLDQTAVDFLARHRCPTVRILSDCPDDVAWFFCKLANENVVCIQDLTIRFGVVRRLPATFLRGIGSQTDLRNFTMVLDDVDASCDIFFSEGHSLRRLETLRIIERSPGTKQLTVWFQDTHAAFESLRVLVLDVALSDAVAGLNKMAKLRQATYLFEEDENDETYEDAELAGLNLDLLELDLATDDTVVSHDTLFEQLQRCAVRELVLHIKDGWQNLDRPLSPALETLVLRMHVTHATVNIDFGALRGHAALRRVVLDIGAPWIANDPDVEQSCRHTLAFTGVPTLEDFIAFAQRITLVKHAKTCLSISPL